MDEWINTISEDMRKHKCSEEQIQLVTNNYIGHIQNMNDFRKAEEHIKTYGRDGYLVYRYKDTIKVRKGKPAHVFYYKDEKNTWHYQTGIPDIPMIVTSKGRVLCYDENDIPKAIEMLKEYYRNKLLEIKKRSITSMANTYSVIGG